MDSYIFSTLFFLPRPPPPFTLPSRNTVKSVKTRRMGNVIWVIGQQESFCFAVVVSLPWQTVFSKFKLFGFVRYLPCLQCLSKRNEREKENKENTYTHIKLVCMPERHREFKQNRSLALGSIFTEAGSILCVNKLLKSILAPMCLNSLRISHSL